MFTVRSDRVQLCRPVLSNRLLDAVDAISQLRLIRSGPHHGLELCSDSETCLQSVFDVV